MKSLPRAVRDYLEARGITARAAAKRRLCFIEGKEAEAKFGERLGRGRKLLGFPYHTSAGKPLLNFHAPFLRGRIVGGEGLLAGMPTKGMKFIQPPGTRNHLYLDPARRDWQAIFSNPKKPLVITEGETRPICATDRGIVCIAIGGVSSWKTRINGRSAPLPELDEIDFNGRLVELAFDSDSESNPDVMAALHAFAVELTRRGAQVVQVVIPAAEDGSKLGLDDYLVRHGAEAFSKLERRPVALVLDAGAPLDAAHAFLGANHLDSEGRTLHFYRGSLYRWCGDRYVEVDPQAIRSEVSRFLDAALQRTKDGPAPFKPSMRKIEDVLYNLRAAATLDAGDPPLWLDGRTSPPAGELIAASNGLFHPVARSLLDHTPLFFNLRAVEFGIDLKAERPARWLKFLSELWAKDAESIATLQEIVGYLLTPDASQQKIFLLVGPPRSGKGTIATILQLLIGRDNVVHPTLSSLAERFGFQPLIGKSLAIVGDARLGGRADQQSLAERLLSVSGQDGQTIDRKHGAHWNGRLGVRFLLLSNEMPRIADASGALPSRFIVLRLTKSFLGREDLGLLSALKNELPGILNWALDGLDRLTKRGRFLQPKSAQEEVELLAALASPMKTFVRDECELQEVGEAGCDELFQAWIRFCGRNGREHPGTLQTFARDLHAVVPGLGTRHVRLRGGGRKRVFTGLRLRKREGLDGTR